MDAKQAQQAAVMIILAIFLWLEARHFRKIKEWYDSVRGNKKELRRILAAEGYAGLSVPERVDLITSRREAHLAQLEEQSLKAGLLLGVATIGVEYRGAAAGIGDVIGQACSRIFLISTASLVAGILLAVIQGWKAEITKALLDLLNPPEDKEDK